MNLFKSICFVLILVLFSIGTKGAAPNWTINAASFQYSMTLTAKAEVNCSYLSNPSNKIAVFVNGQIRGVTNTSNVVSGSYIATMTLYSNTTSNEKMSFKIYNASNDSIYNGVDSILFQENAAYGSIGSPYVVKNNNAPTAMQLNNSSINEGLTINTNIGNFTTSDNDAGETFTYSLVSGTGSTDNANFNISGSTLRTNVILNFTSKVSHNIRIRTTDTRGCFFEQIFTITVNDVNTAPTEIFISDSTVNENSPAITIVGSFSTLDNDVNDTYTYSLVSGAGGINNASFNINGTNLRTTSIFNNEVKSSYSIRVRVTDGASNTFERVFTIFIDDINDAPTDIKISGNSSGTNFAENKALGSLVGYLSTTDEDLSNTFTYSFVNITGNNNIDFSIVGSQLRTNNLFDFETRQNYVLFVQTNDGMGGTFTKQLLLQVIDSNDAPTNIVLSNNTVNENLAANSFVGMLYSIDVDANNTFNYTLVNGNGSMDNADFIIRNDSLLTAKLFNFENKSSYSIRIRTTDNCSLLFEKIFQIQINNANDAPLDISLSANEITENKSSRTYIGVFNTVDQDPTNNFSYSFTAGPGDADNTAFVIIGNELRSNRIFNYEIKNTFSIRVQSNDGNGGFTQKVFNILISDSNDAPSNIVLSTQLIAENLPIASKVCDIISIDEDANDNFNYSFANISGNNNSNFFIIGNELRTNMVFDYEVKNFYIVVLTTTDASGTSYNKQFVIQIKDSVDAPTALELGDNSVGENMPIGEVVGTFTATDADQFTGFNYSLVSVTGSIDNVNFSIVNDTLFTNSSFNFEGKKTYSIRVRVTDITNASFERTFAIQVSDANDAPTGLLLSNNTLQENKQVLTEIGLFSTIDVDANDLHKYTLVSGAGSTDNASFIIDGNSLRTNFSADFESKKLYSIRVATTDKGGYILEEIYVISIIDLSEKPIIDDQEFYVSENDSIGTIIGKLASSSPDAMANLNYSAVGINPFFMVEPTTGNILVNQKLDYEKTNAFSIVIVVKDIQVIPSYDTAIITIFVKDQIEVSQSLPVNNYMTPNGDGYNDYFSIVNPQLYTEYSLSIFNESGIEVYSVLGNYQNNWDGTYQGNKLPTGAYFYVFSNSKTGDKFRGDINIVNQ